MTKKTTTAAPKSNQPFAVKSIQAIQTAEKVIGQLANLPDVFAALRSEVETLKADLWLGLPQEEAAIKTKLDEMQAAYDKKFADLEEEFLRKSQVSSTELSNLAIQVSEQRKAAERQIEELKYDLKLKVERESLEAAAAIAAKHNRTLVPTKDYNVLAAKADEVAEASAAQIEAVRKEVEREKAIALNSLKSTKDAEIELLKVKLQSAESQLSKTESEVEYFKKELAKVPAQIADAVKAAKADISVNQDAAGRK